MLFHRGTPDLPHTLYLQRLLHLRPGNKDCGKGLLVCTNAGVPSNSTSLAVLTHFLSPPLLLSPLYRGGRYKSQPTWLWTPLCSGEVCNFAQNAKASTPISTKCSHWVGKNVALYLYWRDLGIQDDKGPRALRAYVQSLSLSVKRRPTSKGQVPSQTSPHGGRAGPHKGDPAAASKRRRGEESDVRTAFLLRESYIPHT